MHVESFSLHKLYKVLIYWYDEEVEDSIINTLHHSWNWNLQTVTFQIITQIFQDALRLSYPRFRFQAISQEAREHMEIEEVQDYLPSKRWLSRIVEI